METPTSSGGQTPAAQSEDLVTVLLTASRALIALSAQSLVEMEDTLTLSEFRAMVVLRTHGPAGTTRLAQRLGFGPEAAARVSARLVELGFVSESSSVLQLSETGLKVVDAVTARRRAAIAEVADRMSETERRHLVDALIAFAQAAGEPIAALEAEEL